MFDDKARVGSRNSLDGYGGGLAGRGGDLNRAIVALAPAAARPRAGGGQPGGARDAARPPLQGARQGGVGGRSGGRDAGPAVREPRHDVHRARVDRPALPPGVDLRGPAERGAGHPRVPVPAASSCANNAAFFRELRPGVATLPHSAPILADAFEAGTRTLPKTIPMNAQLADVFESARRLLRGPAGAHGRAAADAAVLVAQADARVPDAGPDHLQLRHPVLPQRGERALRRRLERHLAALHHPPEPEHPRRGDRPQQRDRAGVGARPTGRSRTTTSTPTPTRTRRPPARRASARPATSATATRPARRSSATSRATRAPRPRPAQGEGEHAMRKVHGRQITPFQRRPDRHRR